MQYSIQILLPVAYVNPGSGLLLLQLIIAGMVGFLFVFRRSVARILRFKRKGLAPKKNPAEVLVAPLVAKTAEPFPKGPKL